MSGAQKLFAALLFVNLMLVSCTSAQYECSDPLGCLQISAKGQVLIGAMLATSGDQRPLGTSSLASVQQAITDKDNLFTHSIQLITFGTDCTSGSAQTAATEFSIYKNMTAVIGPTCSEELAASSLILLNAGIPLLGPVDNSSAAYTLTIQLLAAIQKVTVRMPDNTLYIPRQALYSALNLTR
jgi:ABC-type branched-subunit amino acid transport system substrate-binding protein